MTTPTSCSTPGASARQKFNNGVLLLVAPTDRRMTIRVGYGIEPLLTDSLCGEIARPVHRAALQEQRLCGRHRRWRAAHRLRSCWPIPPPPAAIQTPARSRPHASGTTPSGPTAPSASLPLGLFVLGILAAIRRLYSTTAFFTVTAISATLLGDRRVLHVQRTCTAGAAQLSLAASTIASFAGLVLESGPLPSLWTAWLLQMRHAARTPERTG